MRKMAIALAIAVAATSAQAQQSSTCIVTGCSNGVCVSTCTPNIPVPLHRPNPEGERALRAERQYYNDAYQYELWRLDQENRR